MAEESICIVDFNGYIHPGHFPTSFWADWWVADKVVTFGGDWCDVPDMPSEMEPTEAEVEAWAEKHLADGT